VTIRGQSGLLEVVSCGDGGVSGQLQVLRAGEREFQIIVNATVKLQELKAV